MPDAPAAARGASLLSALFDLALPVALASMSQSLMGLVDTLMVGRLGEAPLAAVGVATLLFSALAMTLKAVDVAVQSYTARRVGQGHDPEVGRILATGLSVAVVLGGLCTALGLLLPRLLMSPISADPEVRRLGVRFLMWRYPGLVPFLVFTVLRAAYDGIGWTRIGMGIGLGMNVVNAALNWVLIFGKLGAPAMGVAGAALGSTIATTLGAAVALGISLRPAIRRRFRLLHRRNLDPRLLRPFLALAWPAALQQLGLILVLLVFFAILARISTQAVAAGNVVLRVASLSIMPGIGVAVAVQTVVGQALGRRDVREAVRAGWAGVGLSMALMGAFGVAFLLAPAPLLRLFSSSPGLVAAGVPILRLLGLVQVVDAVGLTLAGALRGAGATRAVMAIDIAAGWLLFLPCAWLFGIVMRGGLVGAWIAVLLWFCLYSLGMTVWFVWGKWQRILI